MNKFIDLKLMADSLSEVRTFADELTAAEREAIAPIGLFWDEVNARPRTLTPGAAGFYAACSMPSRDQRSRKTCVSFALTAAVELLAWRRGLTLDLSEQHVAYLIAKALNRAPDSADESVRLIEALRILKGQRICTEFEFPYEDEGSIPSSCAWAAGKYGVADYALIPRFASQTDRVGILTPCLDGPGIANTAYLESIIAGGCDIVVVLSLTDTQVLDLDTGLIVIDCNLEATRMCCVPRNPNYAHAVLITGYVRAANVPYFVCRDSLKGLSCGKPLLISYDYMRTFASYGAVVTSMLS